MAPVYLWLHVYSDRKASYPRIRDRPRQSREVHEGAGQFTKDGERQEMPALTLYWRSRGHRPGRSPGARSQQPIEEHM